MAQLSGTTSADYTQALTLGPDEWEWISVSVWNQTVVGRFFDLGSSGHYQDGSWGEESSFAPGTFNGLRTGGCQFRTNPSTPTLPGLVVVQAGKRGQSIVTGGVQLVGNLSSSGAFTPTGPVLTGAVDPTGAILRGSGFAVIRNGVGDYTVTFTTPYTATPCYSITALETVVAAAVPIAISNSSTFLRLLMYNPAGGLGAPVDQGFTFLISATT